MRQKVISKWGSFDNLLFQSGASGAEIAISKRVNVYFKVEKLFQSGTKVLSKWGSYFKVEHNNTTYSWFSRIAEKKGTGTPEFKNYVSLNFLIEIIIITVIIIININLFYVDMKITSY